MFIQAVLINKFLPELFIRVNMYNYVPFTFRRREEFFPFYFIFPDHQDTPGEYTIE